MKVGDVVFCSCDFIYDDKIIFIKGKYFTITDINIDFYDWNNYVKIDNKMCFYIKQQMSDHVFHDYFILRKKLRKQKLLKLEKL